MKIYITILILLILSAGVYLVIDQKQGEIVGGSQSSKRGQEVSGESNISKKNNDKIKSFEKAEQLTKEDGVEDLVEDKDDKSATVSNSHRKTDAPNELSEAVKSFKIVDSDNALHAKAYNNKLNEIGVSLSRDEREVLYKFLRNGPNDRKFLSIKDSIMMKIEKQATFPPEYIDTLIGISEDRQINGDLRGYAVQHLRTLYKLQNETVKEKIRRSLYSNLNDISSDVSGTAMLTIADLSKKHKGFDLGKFNSEVLNIAGDESAHMPSRIVAVQLCGQQNLKSTLPMVYETYSSTNDVVLKLASVNAIGYLGSEQDIGFLKNIIKDKKNKVLKNAAKNSISKINSRI